MMKKSHLVFFILTLLGLSACGGGSSDSDSAQIELTGLSECTASSEDQAVVCGNVLASDGVTPLVNAEVTLVTGSARAFAARGVGDQEKCLTDGAGDFVCVLPVDVSGEVTLNVSLKGFTTTSIETTAITGQSTEAGSQQLIADTSSKWVVVPGVFDGVQVLLAQLKGCTLTGPGGLEYTSSIHPSEAKGSADCESKGLVVLDYSVTFDGENYVENREDITNYFASNELLSSDSLFINCDVGSNYSTPETNGLIQSFVDQGGHVYFSDLSDNWLTDVFPGNIKFNGDGFTEPGIISASAKKTGLASVVGNTLDIEFDAGAWTAIESIESNVTTFLEADISELSRLDGIRPITVGWKENANSGCVFYTSYHIEGAESVGAPQELAMKYLIQNISSVCQ